MSAELDLERLPSVLEVADDARADRLERQVAGLQRQLTARIVALGDARSECEDLRAEAAQLHAEVARLDATVLRLRSELADLGTAHTLLLSTRTLRWARRPRMVYAAGRDLARRARAAIDR